MEMEMEMRMTTGTEKKIVCLATVMVMVMVIRIVEGGSWCVAKIGAKEEELQKALDTACSTGSGEAAAADCSPIQADGQCYIPNTLQAHASYAFNSFYQRNSRDPHACLFAGTSTIAQTDPSYGSCVYPSSATTSSDGVTNTNTSTSLTTPETEEEEPSEPAATTTAPIRGGGGAGMNPLIPENSTAPSSKTITITSILVFLIIFSLIP